MIVNEDLKKEIILSFKNDQFSKVLELTKKIHFKDRPSGLENIIGISIYNNKKYTEKELYEAFECFERAFLKDKNSEHGFSMVLGYALYFHQFQSEDICVSTISELLPENYEGITRYWSIGFGYRYYLGRK